MGFLINETSHKISLEKIELSKGNIIKLLKNNHQSFKGFGELYFSEVNYREVKGLKLNENAFQLVYCIVGGIEFVCRESIHEKKFVQHQLNELSDEALIIPPNNWYAFRGLSKKRNILLSLINITHDKIIQKHEALSYEGFEGIL